MANELKVILDDIKDNKDQNLLPENLKSGVTVLGIDGILTIPEQIISQEDYNRCLYLVNQILNENSTNDDLPKRIEKILTEKQTNIIPTNIKDGEVILGVTGTYVGEGLVWEPMEN